MSICFALGVICAVCYFLIFYKGRKIRLRLSEHGKSSSSPSTSSLASARHKLMTEIKLAMVGLILALLTMLCGAYCLLLSLYGMDVKALAILNLVEAVLTDVYSWISPYPLLQCSADIRKYCRHFYRSEWTVIGATSTTRCAEKPCRVRLFQIRKLHSYGSLAQIRADPMPIRSCAHLSTKGVQTPSQESDILLSSAICAVARPTMHT